MLSFGYSLLAGMCGGTLEAVGLDPYVGFFHTDRPGRMSLALDLMEEFRSVMVDRFVLTLINKRIMKPEYFLTKENGAVIMTEEGRKAFLSAWQGKTGDDYASIFRRKDRVGNGSICTEHAAGTFPARGFG